MTLKELNIRLKAVNELRKEEAQLMNPFGGSGKKKKGKK